MADTELLAALIEGDRWLSADGCAAYLGPERGPRGLEVVRVAGVDRLAGRPIGVCQKTPLSVVVA